VPGGGVALVRAASALDSLSVSAGESVGVKIVRRAMEEPARRIAGNAGAEGSVVLDRIKNGKGAFGFNAATEEFGDLLKEGIIDPTKVVRTALQNAASVAGLLLTTEAMVAEKPEEKAPAAPAPNYDEM
jgi:chaperonin GroEL